MPRHISIFLIRKITDMSYPNIGKLLGRNHATVMASMDLVSLKYSNDTVFRLEIDELRKDVTGAAGSFDIDV